MLNTAFGGFGWEDDRTISAQIVSRTRGAAPAYQNLTPTEPNIQETSGRTGAVQTFQDLLKSPNDERLFEYYCTSQIARIDIGGKVTEIGAPGIYDDAEFSPDGKYILVSGNDAAVLISVSVRPFSEKGQYLEYRRQAGRQDR